MSRVREVLGRCRDRVRAFGVLVFPDQLADRFLQRPLSADLERGETILIAPPSANNPRFRGGNIGDRAMIEAFLDNVGGPVRLITSGTDDALPARFADRVTIENLPGLIYGWGLGNVRAFATLRRRLAGASHLAVVGADIMDGAYHAHASECRARVAQLAASTGVDSRVLGFSWNASPRPGAAAAVGRAGAAGAALMLRDPVSFARATANGIPGVVEVADMVFAAKEVDTEPLHRYLGADPGSYALVNVSGLVGRTVDQSGEYDAVIDVLLLRGLRVVLLPHVSRLESDDIASCREVYERHRGKDVVLVDQLLRPAGILGLCSRATVVITGRMHLSIMALNSGVSAIALSTQGKVEGLFQLFGLADNCVDPLPGFGRHLAAAAERTLADPGAPARVRSALEGVRLLARRNFDGLPVNVAPQLSMPEDGGVIPATPVEIDASTVTSRSG